MRLLKQYLLKQQLRCHTSDLLGVVGCALGRRAGAAPTDLDAFQHVIGIAVRIRPKISSGRNMDYFHFASDLELLACHRCQCRLIFKVTVGLSEAGIQVTSVLPGMADGERLHWVLETEAQARGISFAEAEAGSSRNVAMK